MCVCVCVCVCVYVTCARASYVCLSYNYTSCLLVYVCACANMRAVYVDSTYDIIMRKSIGQNDVCSIMTRFICFYFFLFVFVVCFNLLSLESAMASFYSVFFFS